MLQIFPKATILALIAALALLMLVVACASAAAPTPVPTPTPNIGKWRFSEQVHDVFGVRVVKITLNGFVRVNPEEPVPIPVIEVQCAPLPGQSTPLTLSIDWKEYLNPAHSEVAWQVDNASASTEKWRIVKRRTTPPPELLDGFIADLKRASKITVRGYFHPWTSTSLTYRTAGFDPAGFAEAYKPLDEACNK